MQNSVNAISKEWIIEAISIQEERNINFFDALMIEAAISACNKKLISKDLQSGSVVDGIQVLNPF